MRMVFFPLENQTDNKLLDWIGSSVPEVFFRKLSDLPGIQAWDPVFLFSVDSTGWQLKSDSLIVLHQSRWEWNIAIGGSYKADADSVWLNIKVVKIINNKIKVKQKKIYGKVKSQLQTCAELCIKLLPLLDIKISSKDSAKLKKIETENSSVYAMYAAGYRYEMWNNANNAVSVYSSVIDMDGSFAPALYRIGMLYAHSRKRKKAWNYLDKAVLHSSNSSIITAKMAEFLIYGNEPDKAMSFIKSNRSVLEETAEGLKAIGMAYILKGEYQRAASLLTRAVAAGPSDLETDFILGKAYLYLGQFQMAAEIFSRLVKYRPRYTRYYSFLGKAYREAGRLMESCAVLENAMKIESDNVPNLINLSNTYFTLNWFEKSEQLLIRAMNLNPNLSEIYVNLGVLYWHKGKKNDAIRMFNRAAEDPINVQSAINNQANMLFFSGDIRKAIRMYKRADKFGKKSEIIFYNLALAYLSVGKMKEAALCFDEVLLLSPGRLDILFKQTQLASKRGLYQKAELYYRKILEQTPFNMEVISKLITLLERQERYKDAVQIVEVYLKNFPQDMEYRIILADLYRKMGWYEVAVMEYQNLLKEKEYKENPKVYLGLGKSMYDMIRFKNARNYDRTIYNLKMAAKLDPANPEIDLIIGSIYMDYKHYTNMALEHWKKALSKTFDNSKREEIEELIKGTKK